ncbi:PTS system mannose/fructose/sorbose family transporter subunit IID [Pediococcus cellicola]|uniref:Phosphoenolpyruvate-dependent sugar phosphotransferase system EIID n=1 Tax=Pediococcus cellicola TaxID=319652 RepID=A0A0R2IJU6_9LACO|nr:PTS system mannose/fructose/sorbose family transporter subunit IID [Pediococcus cellicola]KRN65035.1 phosphoenolpyruvate-dependent sugar phosphotransferase system EIID [Pediococcus cellicola]GEL15878.1 PTS fructose transporter subunit IID [Pediococcus cellicola]
MANTKTNQVTTKQLHQINRRWLWSSQICWNYEKMMATGYLYTVMPVLKMLYKDDELREMMIMHNQFFNTNPFIGQLIIGMDIAIEEKEGIKSKEAVAGLKTGLMGPFAGVGDTIFGVIIPTIFGSISAYMALRGNPIGAIIWMLVNIGIVFLRYPILKLGYTQGAKIVSEYSERLNLLTDSAILLGLTVVGALIPTVVTAKVPFVYRSGKVVLKLQTILNQIMPGLIPVLLVALVYWMLGRKKVTSTKMIIFVMVLAIVLKALNILG